MVMDHSCFQNAYEVIQHLFNNTLMLFTLIALQKISVEMGTEVDLASIPAEHA